MFIGTFGIAVSLTATAFYLTFYSISDSYQKKFESINYCGLLILAYSLTFCFVASELCLTPIYFYVMLTTVIMLGVNLVLVQYSIGRTIAFWSTLVFLSLVTIIALAFCNKHQFWVFFLPMFFEGVALFIAVVLVLYRVPEKWCVESRFI